MPSSSPARIWIAILVALSSILTAVAGCGPKPGYSVPAIRSPLGRHGECFACKKPIESVHEQHLFAARGAQCVVCDKACAAKAAEMLGVDVGSSP